MLPEEVRTAAQARAVVEERDLTHVKVGSGLWGIEHRIEPDGPISGNAYDRKLRAKRQLPRTLTDAAERLARSKTAQQLFGAPFVSHFAASREWEEREFRRAVTDWELARYFEII